MSKYVKNLVMRDVAGRLKDIDSVAVINPRGIDATKTNKIRRKLHAQGVKMMVVKNSLTRRALSETKLKGFEQLLDGPSALVFGKASISAIARILLDEKKADEKIDLRGAFFDGELYLGQKGMTDLSKMPTREEAIATLATLLLSPGRKLAGALKGPAGKLGALLKAIEEKAKEKEAAAPAAAAEAAPAAEAPPAPTATA